MANTVVLNTGDAAILRGMLSILSEAIGDFEATIHDAHPEAAGRCYPDLRFEHSPSALVLGRAAHGSSSLARRGLERISRRPRFARFRAGFELWRRGHVHLARAVLPRPQLHSIEEYARADLIVATGGTYLVENYRLETRILDLTLALELGRPLVLFSQSLGPFRNPANRDAIRRIANGAKLVLLRDELSLGHLVELGVRRDHLVVVADAAFALASALPAPRRRRRSSTGSGLRVAISVRSWSHFRTHSPEQGMSRFLAEMVATTRMLVEQHGASVTYVSTCQGVAEYRMDDSKIASKIVDALPEHVRSAVTVDGSFHTPEALVTMLVEFDLVIATRMHFGILALVAGVPAIPIGYEFKTAEVFRAIGLSHLVEEIDSVTAESLLEKTRWILAHRGELDELIENAVARESARARSAGRALRERLAPA